MAETNSSNVYIGGVYLNGCVKYVLINFNYETNLCQFIPFNSNRIIGVTIENRKEKHFCDCIDYSDMGQADPDCSYCKGSGVYYLDSVDSFENYTLIARTIREYLIQKFVD